MLLALGQRNNLLAAIYESRPFSIIVTIINIIITIATIIFINIIIIIVFEVVVEIVVVVVVANKNHLTNSAASCLEEIFIFPSAI